jgi:hypothetical protein
MDVETIVKFVVELSEKFPWAVWVLVVLSGLGSLVVLAQSIVAITPSKADDLALEKIEQSSILGVILKVLLAFAPVKKK